MQPNFFTADVAGPASRRSPIALSRISAAILAALFLPGMAFNANAQEVAQDPASDAGGTGAATQAPARQEATTLDAVKVTANRRSESIRDVPMAIDVISSEKLYSQNLLDAKDITKVAPGLEMTNNDGRQNIAALRGVSYNPDTGVSVAAVGVYVNDVPVDANVAFNALYDIGQIEVLRGPQGTLRGQMTPAGAITMSTAKPDLGYVGGDVQATLDDSGGRNLRGGFNLPLIRDRLALRFAAVTDGNQGNRVRNITNGRRSDNDTESYRVSLAWQASEKLRFDLMSQQLDVRSVLNKQVIGDGVVTPFSLGRPEQAIGLDDLEGVTDGSDHYDTDARLTTLRADYDLNERHTLSFVASYQDFDLDQGFDRDVGNAVPATSIMQQVDTSVKQKTAELLLSSRASDYWSYTAGVYYQKADSQSDVDVASGSVLIDVPGGSSSKAIFSRQSIHFTDRLTFDFGFRYSELVSERQSILTASGFTLSPSVPDEYARVVDKPLTWGLSLSNRFTDSVTGYAALAHSFRPGTYQVAVFNPVDPELLNKGPEKSDTLEIGAKSLLMDNKVSFNVSAFAQRYDGFIDLLSEATYQYTDPYTGATLRDVGPFNSSGDAEVYGLESQLTARLTPNWDFDASLAYVKSRYTDGQGPCDDSNGDGIPDDDGPAQIPDGQQVAFCPLRGAISTVSPFSASLGSEYRFELEGVQPYIGARVSYRDGFHSDMHGYDYPAFTNVSLFAGFRTDDGRWDIGLFVKNALDQRKITNYNPTNYRVSLGAFGLFDSGYRGVVSTVPRTIGISARYSF